MSDFEELGMERLYQVQAICRVTCRGERHIVFQDALVRLDLESEDPDAKAKSAEVHIATTDPTMDITRHDKFMVDPERLSIADIGDEIIWEMYPGSEIEWWPEDVLPVRSSEL